MVRDNWQNDRMVSINLCGVQPLSLKSKNFNGFNKDCFGSTTFFDVELLKLMFN